MCYDNTQPSLIGYIRFHKCGIQMCSLLRKELHRKGIECSINQYLKSMNSINRVTTFYGDIKKPKKVEAFISGDELSSWIEESNKLQEKYYG